MLYYEKDYEIQKGRRAKPFLCCSFKTLRGDYRQASKSKVHIHWEGHNLARERHEPAVRPDSEFPGRPDSGSQDKPDSESLGKPAPEFPDKPYFEFPGIEQRGLQWCTIDPVVVVGLGGYKPAEAGDCMKEEVQRKAVVSPQSTSQIDQQKTTKDRRHCEQTYQQHQRLNFRKNYSMSSTRHQACKLERGNKEPSEEGSEVLADNKFEFEA